MKQKVKSKVVSSKKFKEQIITDLVKIAQEFPSARLDQFHSLQSAYQYVKLYDLAEAYLTPGSKILDWGAGNGHFSYYLSQSGFKTYSYSFEGFSFKEFTKDKNYLFKKGLLNSPIEIPFKPEFFDCVFSIGVLEHVRWTGGNELASLKEIHRILKPKGLFICYHFPNKYSWIEFLSGFFPNKHHHRYRYSRKDISRYLEAANFELLEIGRYGVLPRNTLGLLPSFVTNSKIIAHTWNFLDGILSFPFNFICQNYFFVAKKML